MRTRDPLSFCDCTVTAPPCASATSRTMKRPSPAPASFSLGDVGLEEPLAHSLGDARTVVDHRDGDGAALDAGHDLHVASRRAELDRVPQQIGDRAVQVGAVARDERQTVEQPGVEAHLLFCGETAMVEDRVFDDGVQVHQAPPRPVRGRARRGHGQERGKQLAALRGRPADRLECATPAGFVRTLGLGDQRLGHTGDRGQRGLEVVRQRREQVRAEALALAGDLRGAPLLFGDRHEVAVERRDAEQEREAQQDTRRRRSARACRFGSETWRTRPQSAPILPRSWPRSRPAPRRTAPRNRAGTARCCARPRAPCRS